MSNFKNIIILLTIAIIICLSCFTISNAVDMNLTNNGTDSTTQTTSPKTEEIPAENILPENETIENNSINPIDNTVLSDLQSNDNSTTSVASISTINDLPESGLGLTNILNILLIVVGVVLILLGIAILIRLKG